MFKNFFKLLSLFILFTFFFLSQNSFAQLTGTKAIPGDYATISAAITDLNTQGVGAGGVTFNVATGHTETTTDSLVLIATGTVSNPIVFQKNGGGANPKITRTDAGSKTTSVLGGQGDAVITIQGSDYVTFNGIDVAADLATIEYGYFLRKIDGTDGCKFVTIQNSVIDMTKGTSAYVAGIYSSNLTASSPVTSATGIAVTSIGGRSESVTLTGNTVQDVHACILLRGFAAATPFDFYDQNFVVGSSGQANILQNYAGGSATAAYGVYLIYHNNPNISYNTINNTAGGGSGFTSTGYGIFHSTATNGSGTYNNNNINLTATTGQLRAIMSGTSGIATLVASNNTITLSQASTSPADGIYFQSLSSGSSYTMSNNTISYGTFASTSTSYMFYGSNAASPVTVTNNQTSGTITKTGAGTFYGYYNFGSPTTGTMTLDNNNFSNITLTGASTFYGIDTRTSTSQIEVVTNNTISNITLGTNAGYGLYQGYGAVGSTVNGNNVYSWTGAGSMYGIYLGTVAPLGLTVYNNNVYNLQSTGTLVVGLYNSAGTANNIYKNQVYNLQANNAAGLVYGMQVAGGVGTYVYNNFFSDLRAPITSNADAIRGINISSTTASSTIGLYYNSIYLNASSTGLNFGTSGVFHTTNATATTAVLDLRNNVIVNNSVPAGTGLNVAFRRSSTTLTNFGSASNNNDLYAGTADATHLLFYDGTNLVQTIGDYKNLVAPRCASAFSENPPFLNVSTTPYNLHMNTAVATQTESGGTTVSTPIAVTDDFDGNTRLSPPDVGADEFTGIALDLTAPSISYTPLLNTGSTGNRTLTASITDASGVPTAGIGLPRLAWKIGALGTYSYVTGSFVSGSNYNFTFGSGTAAGDTVFYYVVAQDGVIPVPNVGAYPSAGAGGFTFNPPAAATPPTNPSSYLVTQAALAGSYTVGLTMFNQVTGMNIYFDKVITKVMKEVDVEVPQEVPQYAKGQEPQSENQTSFKPQTVKQLIEVEEISWIPKQNGQPYYGDLYVKKIDSPEFNYPVGIDGIYATITAAVADLNLRGVGGATTFLLNDASYTTGETYPIVINVANEGNFPTSTNTVTIKPNTGVTALIQGAAAAGQIFKILNSYVSIDGSNAGGTDRSLTIENTSTTTPQVVVFGSTGTTPIVGNTLKNCIIRNGVTSSSAVVVSDGTVPGTAGYFNNITIQNNSIQKAYIGVYNIAVMAAGNGSGLLLTGNDLNTVTPNHIALIGLYVQGVDGATVSNNNIGNYTTTYTSNVTGVWFATGTINSTISNNTIGPINITTAAPRGIVITSAVPNANVTVSGNNVSGIITSYSSAPYGIWVFSTTTGVIIEKNKVSDIFNSNTSGYGARGIHVNTGLATTNIAIRNNFVWNVRATSDASSTFWGIGIGIEGATTGVEIYANSVNLYGSLAGYNAATIHAAFAVITSTANTLNVRDNIFVNTFDNTATTTDKSYAINTQTDSLAFTDINYNDYFVSGVPGVLGYRGVDRMTLTDWQTATGKDANSINADPHYVSDTDLHINTGYNTVSNNGQFISSVTTDIDGNLRSVTTPDIGADEYVFVPPSVIDPSGVSATAISSSQIDVAFTPNASSNNVVIVFDLDGTFDPPVGTPPAPGNPFAGGTLIFNGLTSPYAHMGLTQGTQYFYKAFSYNGSIYSSGIQVDATTLLDPLSVPYSQSFDAAGFPTHWNQTGTATWAVEVSNLAGGTPNEVVGSWSSFLGISRLIVGPFNTTGLTAVRLSFKHFLDEYPGALTEKIQYSVDGNIWTDGSFVNTGDLNLGPETILVDIPVSSSQLYIAWMIDGDHFNFDFWYVDDVVVSIPLANDVGTESIDMANYGVGTISPQATVKNFGTSANTFNVQMTIEGGYSSTQTVTALAPGASQQVTFANWTPIAGFYTVDVCTQLGTDGDPSNDCATKEVGVFTGSWTNGVTYLTPRIYGGSATHSVTTFDAVTNYLYVVGGIDATVANLETETTVYNVNSNTWSALAPMPGGRDRLTAVTVGDFIYAIGGYDPLGVQQNTVFKYDIVGNSWTTVAPLPVTLGWGQAVAYNNRIYVAGGVAGTVATSAVYVYDVAGNTWSTATSMPGARWGGAGAITGNQIVYAAGVDDLGALTNTTFVGTIDGGNPLLITWTTANKPFPGVSESLMFLVSERIVPDITRDQIIKKSKLIENASFPGGSINRFDGATWGTDGVIVATGGFNFVLADPSPSYIYKPGTDTWTKSWDVPIPVIGTNLGSVNDGNTWKLIIAWGDASDGSLIPTDATQIWTDNLGAATFALSVDVTLGWNMVSAPGLHPTNQNVETWWPHRTGTVWEFSGVQYVPRLVTTPGEGYWMKNTLTETYNYPAIQIVPHDPVFMTLGWNLMGGYETSPTITALKAANPQITGTVWGFNGVQYVAATNLVPGYGYWAKVTAAGNITIPDALAKGNGEVVDLFKEDWGRIILTDAAGLSYTLYAVKGEVDLDQYEMPPLPPAGIFDVRYTSGRIAEDLNSIQTIDMTSVEYPITVTVENMTVRLQDETGKLINQNINSGEKITISNNQISKLRVTSDLIPTVYALEQNYPNPFNPSTTIEFSLPEDVNSVKLTIYNALGERVAELINGSLTAGKYSYQWNAGHIATGMYIYELRTDNFVSVKKMMLLK